MQLLGPPPKVALYQRTSIRRIANGCAGALRTGCRKPQKAYPAFLSRPATVPVGIRRRPAPTSLYSCEMIKRVLTPGSLLGCGARRQAYMLYPATEACTGVPAGMGNSLYTFPETPTIGFVRGKTSSLVATRRISITGE